MNTRVSAIILLFLLTMTLLACFACRPEAKETPEEPKPKYEFRKDGELVVKAPDGSVKGSFDIEIAQSEEALQRGLKFRESMEPNQGMLFIFDGRQSYGFWMKDTYLSLDMLFINYENEIFYIAENTTPFSEDPIEPDGYNLYTLELIAGTCKRLNIQKGDTIEWKRTP